MWLLNAAATSRKGRPDPMESISTTRITLIWDRLQMMTRTEKSSSSKLSNPRAWPENWSQGINPSTSSYSVKNKPLKEAKPILKYKTLPRKQPQQPPPPKPSWIGYNVSAHLKKIPAILSIYDTLQISQELRESLIEALSNHQDYQNDMGLPDRIACLATISFTIEKKYANVEGQTNPPTYQGFLEINTSPTWWSTTNRQSTWSQYDRSDPLGLLSHTSNIPAWSFSSLTKGNINC